MQSVQILSTRPTRKCPHCGSESVARSRAQGWERLLRWLRLRFYRCTDCCERFAGFPRRAH